MRKRFNILLFFAILSTSGTETTAQLLINEFVASNSSGGYYDAANDNYPDWIEIYNNSDTEVDLGGYFLTDDLSDVNKWEIPGGTIIPARGFSLFIADDLDSANHTSFKLNAEGESIALSNREKLVLDSIIYMPQSSNISMGRSLEDWNNWLYYTQPTPGAINNTSGYAGKTMPPVNDLPAGFYGSPVGVELETPDNADIYYTLDGSTPSTLSANYTGPIEITSNTVLKAIAFEEGKMNSDVMTASYFIGEDVSLPVFSLSMNPSLVSGFPYDMERPAHVEFFDEHYTRVIGQHAGIRNTGLVDIYPLKTFSLYARSEYGENRLNHRFFKSKPLMNFKNLVLRNGGYQDYSHTYFRDGLIQSFVEEFLDLEYQAYKPVVVFNNGEYVGLYNMREKQNEFYVENNTGVHRDSIDLLEYQTDPPVDVLCGDAEHYNSMIAFIESHDLSVQENLDELETRMDVKNFLDYYMLQIYCANADWPDKNCKIWRPRTPEGKWRWMVFDVDYGYGFRFPVETNMYEYLYTLEEPFYHNRPWVTVIFRKIMENLDLRNYYLQRFCALLNTAFHADRALDLVDSLKAQIEPEIGRHIDKWGQQEYGIPGLEEWQSNCDVLYEFARQRPSHARKNMLDFFQLEDTVEVEIRASGGTVFLNDLSYCSNIRRGQFIKNVPLNLTAVPDNGYEFAGWINASGDQDPSISFVPGSDTSLAALFTAVHQNILEGTFHSDTVLSDHSSPYVARGDLIIPANIHVTLENGIRILMPQGCNIYVYGSLAVNGTEDMPVRIEAYHNTWGGICFDHSTALSELSHLVLLNATSGGDPEIYRGAISAYHADLKLNGTVVEKVPVNSLFFQYGNFEVRNGRFNSEGTGDLINVKHADTAIVEGSIFMNSKTTDTDAIDFDDVRFGIISNNTIHNLIGENSDGIDIGEGAQNIAIYENLITNCRDKGISIGQASTMRVYKNVIYNCNIAIAVKDFGSYAEISNNTLVNNAIGIACYEKNLGSGAGSASVLNTILSDSRASSLISKNGGNILVDYSISNTDILAGTGNLFGDPGIIAPHQFNFQLASNSPCIDQGSPDSPPDSDGSRADMGAYYVNTWSLPAHDIIINEYYSQDSDSDPADWIELFNKGAENLDISGWIIKDGSNNYLQFPENTRLSGEQYLVVCKDTSNFRSFFDGEYLLAGNFDFNLGRSRDVISLFNLDQHPVSSIEYDEDKNWPGSRDKIRLSVALIDSSLVPEHGLNWRTGYKMYGTPGHSNIPPRISGLYINELSGADQTGYPDEYGEYDDWIELYNANDAELNFGGLYLTDDLDDPAKMRIRQNTPDSTVIPGRGYRVLFADGSPGQGILHMDFRISAKGEELGLVQLIGLDTIVLDQVVFHELFSGSSYSRIADGNLLWTHQAPTPGYSNRYSPVISQEEPLALVYPNPADDFIQIRMNQPPGEALDVRILDVNGQVEMYVPGIYSQPGAEVSLDVSRLEPGIYLIQLITPRSVEVRRIVIYR